MSDVLAHLFNACNPLAPASAQFYVDCSDVRGSDALASEFLNELAMAEDHLCFLFSGHIGCGKSSELLHLANALSKPTLRAPHKRYFPIVVDTAEYLDEYDVTPTDILLAIVAEVASALRELAGIELKDRYFSKRLNEVKELLFSDLEMSEGELPLFDAKVKVKLLQKDPTARQKVRAMLLPQMTSMREEINLVFEDARLQFKKTAPKDGGQHYTDIVLILDNLEKIQRLADHEDGEASQQELFIERAPQLRGLHAHVVYTVPLRLVRSHGTELSRIYGREPFVLPMIKVAERGTRDPYKAGRNRLRELLQKRAGDTPLQTIFDTDALEWLLTYCGGHTRDLMAFVRRACASVMELPIPLRVAQKALGRTIALYSTSIPDEYWPKLARLDLSSNQQIDNNDPDYRKMLEQVSVMEYVNGGDESNSFRATAPWYAVNPIVRELSQFQAARAALEAERDA